MQLHKGLKTIVNHTIENFLEVSLTKNSWSPFSVSHRFAKFSVCSKAWKGLMAVNLQIFKLNSDRAQARHKL